MELLLHSRLQDRVIEKSIRRPRTKGDGLAPCVRSFSHLPFSNMAQIGPDARKNARAEGRRRTKISRYYVSGLIRKIVLLFYSFIPFAFYKFGSDGSRYEELPASATTADLRRQQSDSAATRELLRESSPNRRRVSFLAARGRYV